MGVTDDASQFLNKKKSGILYTKHSTHYNEETKKQANQRAKRDEPIPMKARRYRLLITDSSSSLGLQRNIV